MITSKEGAQQKIYRSLQDVQTGKVIGKDFCWLEKESCSWQV